MKLQVDVASALNLQGARGLQWKTSLILLGDQEADSRTQRLLADMIRHDSSLVEPLHWFSAKDSIASKH